VTLTGTNKFEIKSVSIDASASSQPVAIGDFATLSATVVNESLTPVKDVSVSFILTYYDASGDEQTLSELTGFTESDGIVTISDVSVPYVKVYKVTAIAGGGCGDPSIAYLPVYDPSAGFVTGGGWIWSTEGALTGVGNENVTGKANFGFNAKYKKGNKEVDGNTEFQFKAGDLNFKSSSHDAMTLVISGAKATYKGKGLINKVPGYAFMVSVIDGDVKAKGEPDLFRIKIWVDGSPSNVIYDNQLGVDENADATTELGGGSIVIHNPKGKNTSKGTNSESAEVEELFDGLKLVSWPNPSDNYFNLELKSNNTIDKISIQVFDLNGRLVSFQTGNANQEYQIGEALQAGLYFVNVIQGNEIKQVKLIKH